MSSYRYVGFTCRSRESPRVVVTFYYSNKKTTDTTFIVSEQIMKLFILWSPQKCQATRPALCCILVYYRQLYTTHVALYIQMLLSHVLCTCAYDAFIATWHDTGARRTDDHWQHFPYCRAICVISPRRAIFSRIVVTLHNLFLCVLLWCQMKN